MRSEGKSILDEVKIVIKMQQRNTYDIKKKRKIDK